MKLHNDVVSAYKLVTSVVSVMKSMRRDSLTEFKKLFTETTKLGQDLRQVHRNNPEVSSPEDFFRITLCDEFLSQVVAELEERFVNNPAHVIAIGL